MPLTATAINAPKPKAKPYKLTDELDLYRLVTPAGGWLWRMNYRFDGSCRLGRTELARNGRFSRRSS